MRSGSISGRLRSASELEEKGFIDRVQKGALKDLILSGDEQLLAALDKFAVEGDAQELKALLRSGLLEGQHADFDLDLLVDDLDLNFLQLSHSLGTELGDGGDAYVQFHMDDVASFLVGDAPLPAATAVAAASASAAASPGGHHAGAASGLASSAAASAASSSSAKAAAAPAGAAGAQGQGKQQQQGQPSKQQHQHQQQPGSMPSSLLVGEEDLLSAMGDRVAGTLGRSMSPTHASNLVAFGVSPFEAGNDGALAGLFIKEEPPSGAQAEGDSSLAASLMPTAAAGGGGSAPAVNVKAQPPSGSKAGAAAGKAGGKVSPVGGAGAGVGAGAAGAAGSAPVAIGAGGKLKEGVEREDGKVYIGAYSPESRKKRLERFWEKKKNRIWDRKVKYDVRKNFADSRIRVKGRFVKKEDEAILLEVSTLTSKQPGDGTDAAADAQSHEAQAAGELAALMGDDALAALEGLGVADPDPVGLPPSPPSPPSAPSPPGSPVIPALDP